jgi:hypothetical protein
MLGNHDLTLNLPLGVLCWWAKGGGRTGQPVKNVLLVKKAHKMPSLALAHSGLVHPGSAAYKHCTIRGNIH